MKDLTLEDYRMLKYFWEEKGSLERYCAWESLLPTIQMKHPSLYFAYMQYVLAKSAISNIINDLCDV